MSMVDSGIRPNNMIARQHIQIKALLDALSSRFDSSKTATRNLVSLLNSLAVHLETHFELEEENDYFGYILSRAPRLSDRVDQLLQQHKTMRVDVDELVEMARQAFSEDGDTTEFASKFQRLRDQLLSHENAENEMLQEAYTCDLGGSD